jgi:hypothetical protein
LALHRFGISINKLPHFRDFRLRAYTASSTMFVWLRGRTGLPRTSSRSNHSSCLDLLLADTTGGKCPGCPKGSVSPAPVVDHERHCDPIHRVIPSEFSVLPSTPDITQRSRLHAPLPIGSPMTNRHSGSLRTQLMEKTYCRLERDFTHQCGTV